MTFHIHPLATPHLIMCDCAPGASPHQAQWHLAWDDADERVNVRCVCDTGLGAALRKAYGPQEEKR